MALTSFEYQAGSYYGQPHLTNPFPSIWDVSLSHLLWVPFTLLSMDVIKLLPTTHIPFITGSLLLPCGSPTNCHLHMGVSITIFCVDVSRAPCSMV